MTAHAKLVAMGALLGFALSNIGFTSWDEVHAMFTFADLRLFLTFAVGVTVLTAAFAVLRARARARGRALEWPPRPFHRGTLAGGAIFGLGWALSGACPGVIFTQIGEGKLYALLSLAGVFAGNALYGALFERRPASRAATGAAQRA